MIEVYQNDDSIKAVGINSNKNRKEFVCEDDTLLCHHQDLISIEIPEGIKKVFCSNNQLTELIIPESVELLSCYNNSLTELNLTKNVKAVYCDKHILGLDKYINWNYKIILY